MGQIAQLKYYMNFSLQEMSNMTAEDREFYIKWFADMKNKENEAKERSMAPDSEMRLGPSA